MMYDEDKDDDDEDGDDDDWNWIDSPHCCNYNRYLSNTHIIITIAFIIIIIIISEDSRQDPTERKPLVLFELNGRYLLVLDVDDDWIDAVDCIHVMLLIFS